MYVQASDALHDGEHQLLHDVVGVVSGRPWSKEGSMANTEAAGHGLYESHVVRLLHT
jgi:hypothetical protein